MNEVMKCGICGREILSDDDYAELKHYPNGKLSSVGYYHTECFRNVHFGNKRIQKKAEGIMEKANKLIKGIA